MARVDRTYIINFVEVLIQDKAPESPPCPEASKQIAVNEDGEIDLTIVLPEPPKEA
jgi:hypothetical protein